MNEIETINRLIELLNKADQGDKASFENARDIYLLNSFSGATASAIRGRIKKAEQVFYPSTHKTSTMLTQHDYTQRLYDLMIMRNSQRYRWQGSLASAKWYVLHARNTGDTAHQNVCATRARQRYEGAARLAKLDGVPNSEFLAYWKSL